jgi:hypothetical protein
MMIQKRDKKTEYFIKKTVALILVGVFLLVPNLNEVNGSGSTNTLSWAKEEGLFSAGTENSFISSGPAQKSKLAPSSRLNSEDFKYSLTVGAICKHVEHSGNLDDKSYLTDVLARLDTKKNPNITVLPYEIIIEIPNEGLAVRYFDPTKANVITPYSDISKLETKVIGPRLNRQIIYKIKALPAEYVSQNDAFRNLALEYLREHKIFDVSRPLTIEDIRDMHIFITEHSDDGVHKMEREDKDISPGQFRNIKMVIYGTIMTCPPEEISAQMTKFIEWLNMREGEISINEAEELDAEAFLRFIMIHPFSNGSGRTGRLLLNLLLLRHGKRSINLNLLDWNAGPYDYTPEDVKFLAFLIREAQTGKSMKGYRRYSGIKTEVPYPYEDALSEAGEIPAGFFLDWMQNRINCGYIPRIDMMLKIYKKTRLSHDQFKEFLRILHIGAVRVSHPENRDRFYEAEKYFRGIRDNTSKVTTLAEDAVRNDTSSTNKIIADPALALYEMLGSYDKEDILSAHGKKVLACLQKGKATANALDFDIERLKSLTYPKAIEQLVMLAGAGGLNNGKNLLFISPEEYLERNPWAVSKRVRAVPEAIRLMEGCDNNCLFCMFGGYRQIRSVPYPIVAQRILQTYFGLDGFKGHIGALSYYDGDEDTFHYHDEICGANIAHVVFFEQKFPGTIPISHELRTAGYSPFNPKMCYVGEAIKHLQAEELDYNMHLIIITYNLFRPEIEEALLQKDEVRLKQVITAYMRMYRELFLVQHRFKLVLNRTTLENTVNPPKIIEKITEIQVKVLDILKKDDEIKKAFIVFYDEPIGWEWGGRAISTMDRFREVETRDSRLVAFLDNLDIDQIVSEASTVCVKSEKNKIKNHLNYIKQNETLFKDMLGENKLYVLLRVPIEAIRGVGKDNIRNFLTTFQEAHNGYLELYSISGIGEIDEGVYREYGLQKKPMPKDFRRTRENTITLFPVVKGEEIDESTIVSKLGSLNLTVKDTILSPIGREHDPAGLIRATILGLKIMDIARQIKEGRAIDKDTVHIDILNKLRNVCDMDDFKNFDLTPDDIIALASGNINSILIALKKLIKLLPITPINAEELRQIYEHAKAVITAA